MKYLFVLLAVVSLFAFPIHAQNEGAITLTLSSIPTDPAPGQSTTIEATSYDIDLAQVNFIWRYNNQIIASGTGKTRITVTAPASGTAATITATVSYPGVDGGSASLILRGGAVDLLWEAYDAYTPPFYKGKAMVPDNGIIRAMAVPQTSSKSLSYTWSRNGSVLGASSGYQKNSLLIKNDTLNPREQLSVTATGGVFTGSALETIVPRHPGVTAYKKSEGFIDYANGFLSDVPVTQPGVVVRFEPFYFSIQKNMFSDLVFDITNNGNSVIGDPYPNELRLARPDNGGQSTINVHVGTNTYSLQNIDQPFTISFQ